MTPEELLEILRKCWSIRTSVDPAYWRPDNSACGQCVATTQLVQKFFDGEIMGGKTKAPGCVFINKLNHFWNRLPDGREIDFTKEQFSEGTMILDKQPVKRSYFVQFPETIKKYAILRVAVEQLLNPNQRKIKVFITGNQKMGPEVLIFNLPPLETCRPTIWCKENCYALKGRHYWQSVKESQQIKLELSKRPDFVELALTELKKSRYQYVRLHSAGDFYSEEYARKWIEIIKRCPEKLFRTTTKRTDLGEVLRELDSLPNMIVRESLDITRPKPSGFLPNLIVIEGTPINRKLFSCRDACVSCKYTCWKKRVSILVKPF